MSSSETVENVDTETNEVEGAQPKTHRLYFELVMNEDGSVNKEASAEVAAEVLANYIQVKGRHIAMAIKAANDMFDKYKGVRISPVKVFIAKALVPFELSLDDYTGAAMAMKEYLKFNSSLERDDGKTFCVEGGKNGGVFRWSDRRDRVKV